jgi:ubiquinone/menaquinone biosynthesis C-methylase UbiE
MKKNNDAVREYFDDWSEGYDRAAKASRWTAPEQVFRAVAPYLEKNSRILDVAIGTGILSAKFRKASRAATITGLDISAGMLRACAEKGVADTLKRCDVGLQRFPLPDHDADVTVASGVFELLGRTRHVFSEMVRVTKPGGIIAFSYTPNSGPGTRVYDRATDEVPIYSHSSRQVGKLMAGLGVEKIAHTPRFTGLNAGRKYPNRVFVGRVGTGGRRGAEKAF